MKTGRTFLRPARGITDLINSIIDFIYPPICVICGEISAYEPFICESCFKAISIFDATPDSIRYHVDHPAKHVKALYYFDKNLQNLVHNIKYRDADYMAVFLGKILGKHYKEHEISQCDALIPVPLHSARKRERTYNQSAKLAKGISAIWDVKLLTTCLKRKRYTNTQTKLNKEERQANITGAFSIRHAEKIPKRVCIIDDVFTTGATTMEIARTLKNVGVEEINILCLATPFHNSENK